MIKYSVAIPVYNRLEMVQNSLVSALKQDIPSLEIIVVDNASTDGTWESLQRFKDNRLKLYQNKNNLGLFGNFNRCLELARGRYIRILCSDDLLENNCLGADIEILKRHPEIGVLSNTGRMVRKGEKHIRCFANGLPPGIYDPSIPAILKEFAFYGYNPLNYPSGITLNRELALAVGGFDETFKAAGDVDLFLRILEKAPLYIAAHCGARITCHSGQVGAQLLKTGVEMQEMGRLFKKYLDLNQGGHKISKNIARQYAALCFAKGVLLWTRGLRAAGKACIATSQALGGGALTAFLGTGRIAFLRMSRRLTRQRHSRSLNDH